MGKEEVCHGDNLMCIKKNKPWAYDQSSITANPQWLIFEVSEPILLAGVLIGAMLPYLFGALTMLSVGKAAAEMIQEVRRQFREVTNPKTGMTLMEAIQRATKG